MTANLVKIKDVQLYVAMTSDAAKCYEMKKLLESRGVPYVLMSYMDDSHHEGIFKSLNTWSWGRYPEPRKIELARFPLLIWKECWDDYEISMEIATDIKEVRDYFLPKAKTLSIIT